MLEVESITAISVIGLLVSLLLIACGLGIFWAWRRIQLKNNSSAFIAHAQSLAQQRAITLKTWLLERLKIDAANADRIMTKHLQQESAFFESMQANMVEQNMTTLQQVSQSFDRLQNLFKEIEPTLNLTQGNDYRADTSMMEIANNKIEQLAEKNHSLTTELRITKNTLTSVLEEYAEMFTHSENAEAMPPSSEKLSAVLDKALVQLEAQLEQAEEEPKIPAQPPSQELLL